MVKVSSKSMPVHQTSVRKYFLELLRPHKQYMMALMCIGIYWALNNSFAPFVLKMIIDKVVVLNDNKTKIFEEANPYIFLYIALWVLVSIDMRLSDWVRSKLFARLRYDVTTKMFDYLGRHSQRYFQNNFAGSLVNKISDMQSAATTILSTLDDAFARGLGLLIAVTMMLLVHPVFALILSLWAASFILVTILFFQPMQNLSNVFAASKTVLIGKMVDSINNIIHVKLFCRSNYENENVKAAAIDTIKKDRAMQVMVLKMRALWDFGIVVLISINVYALVNMYAKDQVSIGDFSFIISLSISIFYNLWYLAGQFVSFAGEVGKFRQALTIISVPHEITDKHNSKTCAVRQGCIEFKNVTFHYENSAPIFNDLSVMIRPAEKVGLVGLSGSGKSTFVNLILRLFDIDAGQILIDDQDIRELTQDSLRANIAMIPQDITLFHRTLMENIRYGRLEASDEEVIAASKQAHCHEFVSQWPEGYQSFVGERGVKLSGGQRQRIAIARAMLKNAPILILDETTSALDSMTEKIIQQSLRALMNQRTTIVIAHRLSTLAEMDRILVFDQGKMVESGSHEMLMKLNGHYARMWNMQSGGFMLNKA